MSQTSDELLASLNQRDIARRLQEYQALLANDSVGILVVCDGEIMQCNQCAARLFGWEQADLLGRPAARVFASEEEFQSFATKIGDALAADGSPSMEWKTVRRDGARFWARLLVKSITPGGLAGETVWMVEDVTERKATEAQLARAREELENRVRAAHDELSWTNERLVAEMYERSEVEERARRMALYDHWTGLPNRRLLESRLDEAVRNHQLAGDRLAVLFLAGARIRHLLVPMALGIAAMALLAVTSSYRLRRLTAFRDPWQDPFDSGFQLTQSLIAIGRGEWFGVGLGSSVQKLFYLPEAHTDFVFAVLAEEFGFAGVVIVIALFGLLVGRALFIARNAARAGLEFQSLVAAAIGVWLGLQVFVNIGVNMGLLPTKGLTLPLLSYGGSSMLVTLGWLGVLLRVHHETQSHGRPAVAREARRE